MKKMIEKNRNFMAGMAVFLVIGAILPHLIHSTFAKNTLILSLIWSIMGIGWNYIGGYAGQVSNGHALYFAIGAYAVAICSSKYGMTPWISMWIGIAISAGLAWLLGKPLLRLNGAYFLIATMAVAESARIILLNTKSVGGATGIMFLDNKHSSWYSLQFKEKEPFYYLLLVIVVLLLILSKYLDKSRFGYYLRAIRINEVSSQSAGINTPRYKVMAYMLSAVIVSLAGSLYAPFVQYIDPYVVLPLDKSTMICLVVVMGGVGTIGGPVLGAFVMTFFSEYLRSIFAGRTGVNMLVYGVIVVFIVLFLPNGLVSLWPKLKGLFRIKSKKEQKEAANG